MLIVARPIVGLATAGGGPEFLGERGRPLLPGEVTLLGELDGERKRLCFPGLGKHRPALIARQSLEVARWIRLAQGSHPTCRYRQNRAARPARPTARARRSAPSIRA